MTPASPPPSPSLEREPSPATGDNTGNPFGVDDPTSSDAIEDPFMAADTETKAILYGRVASSSRSSYDNRNVNFMLWLYDNRDRTPTLLEPLLMPELDVADEEDKARRTAKGRPSTSRNSLRAACKLALGHIEPSDQTSHPIKLKELDFVVFSRFLATFKKRITRKRKTQEVVMEGMSAIVRLSHSSFDGACSALSHLYKDCGLDKDVVSQDLWHKLGSYKRGSRRAGAQQKKKLGLNQTEGKAALPFAAYQYLASILFESEDPEDVAAHTFLVLEWNLVARAEYVIGSKIDHVAFKDDAMVFEMGPTKCDQEGTKNLDHPWHCYSCPEHPEICCHLAIARYFMAHPTVLNGECSFF